MLVVADNVGTNSVSTYVNIMGKLPFEVEKKLKSFSGFRKVTSLIKKNMDKLMY